MRFIVAQTGKTSPPVFVSVEANSVLTPGDLVCSGSFSRVGPISASVYNLDRLAPIWMALHIVGGQVALPLAVLTFIFAPRFASAGRPRYLTLINFCVTWIVYSVVHCILLYSGQANQNLEAPTKLCLAQASLIHGAPPMAAVAGLEMVVQLWCVQKRIYRTDVPYIRNLPERLTNSLILVLPYIVFVVFSLLTLGHGLSDENAILSLNHIYCTTQNYRFSLIVPTFCAIVMSCIIFIEISICYNWYKTRKEVNALFELYEPNDVAAIREQYQRSRHISVSISIRVGLFTMYCVATLSACLVFVSNTPVPFPYMVEASLPTAAFLLFGTQRDIIELWFCCRLRRKSNFMVSDEKQIPSARPSQMQSIESILAPSDTSLTSSTFISHDLSLDGTSLEDGDCEGINAAIQRRLCN
ncbi:hypothetical protein DFH11DRAFT_1513998 [Phellopilus nigrolimitatus]|nr:hypothetical protein DFH11DRAFT_1513998 [Phellopilus nigrolimitatus]